MAMREVTVAAAVGLHARPAAALARAAQEAARTGSVITVGRVDGPKADASSIVSVMSLGARQGDTLLLEVNGDGAELTLQRLASLIESEDAG